MVLVMAIILTRESLRHREPAPLSTGEAIGTQFHIILFESFITPPFANIEQEEGKPFLRAAAGSRFLGTRMRRMRLSGQRIMSISRQGY